LIASSYFFADCTARSAGFSFLEDAINVDGGAPVLVFKVRTGQRKLHVHGDDEFFRALLES
jgi:hypothetical protein